jgi:pyruvate dehydrogenase E2 component (dihydrolipoamide acetyltransferase)
VGTITEVFLPDLGDFKDVDVIEVLVQPGDKIETEQSVLTLESEKATMEIPSAYSGEVKELKVAVGDKISAGALIMVMDVIEPAEQVEDESPVAVPAPAAPVPEPPAAAVAPEPPPRAYGEKEPQARPVIARPSDAPRGRAHASPAVRRFARELGVDLMAVPGSGSKGRITKEDVQNYVKQALSGGAAAAPATGAAPFALPAAPEVDFSRFGAIETQPLGRIKKISGAHLHRSWLTVPHVTQFDEADITELEAFRKAQKDVAAKQELKLTFMPFLLKAVAAALKEFPQVNSSLSPDGESLILKKYVNIGVAVDTPNGLVVPVVRDVDQKGVFQLAADLMELSGKAREGKLAPADMQGGCISISSLGGIGGTQFTPIVNAPEVAILGISRAEMKPKWNGKEFEPRLMMPFSLSYDHRVIDGAEGVRFTTYLNGLLSDIRKLVL